MSGGLGSRLGSAGLVAGIVVALLAGSSGVAAAQQDLGDGCTYYAPSEQKRTECPNWDARRKDLSGLNFTGANLRNALFHHANLSGTNFTNADLTRAMGLDLQVSADTQLSGALVNDDTHLAGLVAPQEVKALPIINVFIVGGVNPGSPFRFLPPATAKGVFIDECRGRDTLTAPNVLVNGQRADVLVLRPGKHSLRCTFFTDSHQQGGRGRTTFEITVRDSRE